MKSSRIDSSTSELLIVGAEDIFDLLVKNLQNSPYLNCFVFALLGAMESEALSETVNQFCLFLIQHDLVNHLITASLGTYVVLSVWHAHLSHRLKADRKRYGSKQFLKDSDWLRRSTSKKYAPASLVDSPEIPYFI